MATLAFGQRASLTARVRFVSVGHPVPLRGAQGRGSARFPRPAAFSGVRCPGSAASRFCARGVALLVIERQGSRLAQWFSDVLGARRATRRTVGTSLEFQLASLDNLQPQERQGRPGGRPEVRKEPASILAEWKSARPSMQISVVVKTPFQKEPAQGNHSLWEWPGNQRRPSAGQAPRNMAPLSGHSPPLIRRCGW